MNSECSFAKRLMAVISFNAHTFPNKQAICDSTRQIRYVEFFNEIKKTELLIDRLGLQAGSVAIIQLPNRTMSLVLLMSLLNKGIKPLFAAPALGIKEIEALRDKTNAGYYFFPEEYGDIDYLSLAEKLVKSTSHGLHTFKVGKDNFSPSFHNECDTSLLTDSPYILFLTSSGSTGLPKVIALSDEIMIGRCLKWINYCGIDGNTRFLAYLSLMYPMTLHAPGVLTTLLCGGSVFLADRADSQIQCFLSMFGRYSITHSALVPSFAAEFVRVAEEGSFNFDTLEVLEIGGEPLSDVLAEKIRKTFNCKLFEIYGMTEGFGFTTTRSDIRLPEQDLHFEYRVVPVAGETANHGNNYGELQLRGSKTFSGYYNEDNTKFFTKEGWFITGDIVEIDEQGQILSAKRKKDVINKNGTKISCHEVETILEGIDFIATAAVVPYSCEDAGQRICAFVTGENASSIKIKEAFMRSGVSEIKFPDKFIFLEHLPINSRLKVDRVKLLKILGEK